MKLISSDSSEEVLTPGGGPDCYSTLFSIDYSDDVMATVGRYD